MEPSWDRALFRAESHARDEKFGNLLSDASTEVETQRVEMSAAKISALRMSAEVGTQTRWKPISKS